MDVEQALAPHIRLIRLRAEAALLRRLNAGYGFADASIPGEVFLRDEAARERMSRDSLRPHDSHVAQAAELDDAIAEARAAAADGQGSPLELVCERFGLTAGERALLTVALTYELDPDVRDLCHALAWRRRSALFADVCQELSPELGTARALMAALHPASALRRGCLLEVDGELGDMRQTPARATCGSALALSRRVLDWLLGDERMAAPLHTLLRLYPPEHDFHVYLAPGVVADIERIAALLGRVRPAIDTGDIADAGRSAGYDRESPLVVIQGPLGAGKRAAAHRLAMLLGRPLAVAPLADLLSAQERTRDPSLTRQVLAEIRLRHALPFLPGIDRLGSSVSAGGESHGDSHHLVLDALAEHAGVVIVATTERGMPTVPIARPFHLIRMAPASVEVRQAAWATGLAVLARGRSADAPAAEESTDLGDLDESTAVDLGARYVIGPGTIGEVVDEARIFAQATGAPVRLASIEEAVARRLAMRLGSFGTLITRRARLEEMVLPDDVIETLGDMVAMVRERTRILENWGYGKHLGLSRGVSALFSGEPGTGKTMAASVLSSTLGLELIRIDLSAVTSKWVGETEKHLAKIFDEAQTANAMLLFDEADSLFGKRTEVKSAQDRYANLEVNYILQRMETFDGVSVLTTNLESAIDAAFQRRLNFRVRFPKPDVDERMELWRRLLPPETGIAAQVDFEALADKFDMTGGHIRNAIVRAAVIAAREGRPMRPQDLLAGAHHEYMEMGKVMPSLL